VALLQFLSRPFVPGDSIQLQGPSNLSVSGTVERVAPMRTMLRTDDDTLVSIPNKVKRGGLLGSWVRNA
jgi:small-conductance mechanosensitive channel